MSQPSSSLGVPNPEAGSYTNRRTTNVRLEEDLKAKAKAKAKAQGQDFWEYVTKLIEKDLGIEK